METRYYYGTFYLTEGAPVGMVESKVRQVVLDTRSGERGGVLFRRGNHWFWSSKAFFCARRKGRVMRSKSILVFVAAGVIVSSVGAATATVVVSCQDLGNGVAEFSYDASDESVLVRAFALDITVDSGATIESIFDYKVGQSTAEDPGYGIFPGSIVIDPDNGGVGSPVVNPDEPGALGGLGTSGVTVEMASLYEGQENAPLASDTLFRIAIDWHGAVAVDVAIAQNTIRGGIVMEEPEYNPTIQLVGCTLVPEPAALLLLGVGVVLLRRTGHLR